MASSSPVGSSPSKTPLRPASKRYVSNVYSRRSAGAPIPAAKRAKRTPTPDSDSELSDADDRPIATLPNGDKVILGAVESDSEGELPKAKGGRRGALSQRKEASKLEKLPLAKAVKPTKGKNVVKPTKAEVKLPTVTKPVSPVTVIPPPPADSVLPSRGAKRKAIPRTDTEIDITSAVEAPPLIQDVPPITVQPATSSPSILASSQALPQAPATPPRKKLKRTLTPQSSPRDLSALFAPVSPARSPALTRRNTLVDELSGDSGQAKRGGGLFRRMLDKTQSLGAIPSPAKSNDGDKGFPFGEGDYTTHSPGPSALLRTLSLPTTPSKTPAKDELAVQSLIVPVASSSRLEATALGSGGKGKRTYGRSRTILAETNDSPHSGVSSAGDRDVIKESYAELRKQFEVDNSGEDLGSGNLMLDLLAVRGGQSVSDLRSKGENRRFMDELGYLVDPILDSSTSIGLKRSSIYDILRSMQDEEWLQRAKICGQVERIWEAIYDSRGDGDEVIEAMCLLYLVNLVKSGSGLDLILRSHDETCERILLAALKVRDGPLDELCRSKSSGIVLKLRTMYKQLDLGWISTTLSTRRLASFLLAEITSPATRPSSSSASLLATEKAITRISKSVTIDATELAGRFDLIGKGLPLLPTDPKPDIDIDHISQSLAVLSRLVSQGTADRQALSEAHESMAPIIVNSLIVGIHLALNGPGATSQLGSTITIQSLKILATMSNSSPAWSESIPKIPGGLAALTRALLHRSDLASAPSFAIADHDLEDTIEDQDEGARFFSPKKQRTAAPSTEQLGEEDVLCLVLVILTASILGPGDMTQSLASLCMSSKCKGAKACLLGCKCPKAEFFAAHLVKTYVHYRDSEATAASLIAAYIALILSKLTLHQPSFLDLLPGEDKHSNLVSLIEVLSDLNGLQSLLHTRLKVAAGAGAGTGESGEKGPEGEGEGMEGDAGVVDAAIEDLRRLARELEG